MSNMFDKHAPFKKITKYKQNFKNKPEITTLLQENDFYIIKSTEI